MYILPWTFLWISAATVYLEDHPANRAAEPRGWDDTVEPARSESPVDRW